MKIIRSLVTLVIVIALGLFVYFKVYKNEEARKERERNERQLVRFNFDLIKRFELARPESSMVFERGIGRLWNITEPIQTEAAGEPLLRLFSSLNQTDILVEVEKKPKKLDPYGLALPPYYMAMEYDVGDPDTLFIGNETPDGTMSYVRFASEDRVLAVANPLTALMKKPVKSYRARTILNVLADDIVGIEIFRNQDGEEDRIQIAHNGVTWFMQHPWELPADEKNLVSLAEKMGETKKKALVEEVPEDLSKYGLDTPAVAINVSLKYGMPDKMLLIGSRLTGKGQTSSWYAKQFDKDLVFTLDNALVTMLNRSRIWFVDKQPLRFNREAVDKIEIDTGEQKLIFTKDADMNWSVVSPIDKNIPKEVISSIFGVTRFLIVRDIYSFSPTEEDYEETGVKQPTITFNFFSNNRKLIQVFFGKTFTDERPLTYVLTSMSPLIYVTGTPVSSNINNVLNMVFEEQ